MTKFNLIKLNAIGSTNDWLKNKLQSGNCHDGDVVWTMNQTKGRGQYSNVWSSDSQKNITFSVFKRFSELNSDDSFLINCAVTLAIIETLEKFKIPNLKIKWPNDILSANNKIGGVLIENIIKGKKLNASITGIGINVNQKSFIDLPSAGSMFLQTNKKYDLKKVFEELLETLDLFFNLLKKPEKVQLLSSFEKSMYKKGEWCQFKTNGSKFLGRIVGVSDHGLLIIEKKSKKLTQYRNGGVEMIY